MLSGRTTARAEGGGRRAHRKYPLGAPGALPESCIVSHEARGADGEEGTHSTDLHPCRAATGAAVWTPVSPHTRRDSSAAGYPRLFHSLVVCTQRLSRVKTDLDARQWPGDMGLTLAHLSSLLCIGDALTLAAPQSLEANETKKRYRGGWAWRRWLEGCENKWELGFAGGVDF